MRLRKEFPDDEIQHYIEACHNVNKKYLPLYLNEFQFRDNHRRDANIFGRAIGGC